MKKIYSEADLQLVDKEKIPHHIAIIMDGNRRWAKKNGVSRIVGHKKGAENLTRILKASLSLGIKVLTVFAFSTENWNRSKKEIEALMRLFETYLIKYSHILKREKIRLRTIGDSSKCSRALQKLIDKTKENTADGDKLDLVLAINYGGRDEITRAVKNILNDYDKGMKNKITENFIASYLDTAFCPDPELVIRTSGELRLSNFLLWQMSYSEFYAIDVLWPDFSERHLLEAILGYQKRERRFGRT